MIGPVARLAIGDFAAPLAPGRADPGVLREVLAQARVVQTPAGPRLGSYFAALAAALVRWIARAFHTRPELSESIALAVSVTALALLAAALSVLAIWLWRRLAARRSAPAAAESPSEWQTAPDPASARGDRSRWRSRIDELLSAGDVAGALEAVWWWFASSLDLDGAIDGSWTTRELLRRAGRPELSPSASTLDLLMYGRRVPSPADVVSCVGRLEKILA
ncbi:MAG TPA: hypothetical protein VKG23_11375 [Thermoanaerobaculia bacterium]|nr:hypothetical protein [Thermoanaerobaculia bacterium]